MKNDLFFSKIFTLRKIFTFFTLAQMIPEKVDGFLARGVRGPFVSWLLNSSHGRFSWLSAARCCQHSSCGTRLTAALSRIDADLTR